MDNKVIAIILAGGNSRRVGGGTPKQFLLLGGKPLVLHSVDRFFSSGLILDIIVVCHKDHMDEMAGLAEEKVPGKIKKIVPGGSTRQESSFLGVKSCPPDTEFVIIHDAARPFVSKAVIKNVLDAARRSGAATAAAGVSDTVMTADNGFIGDIPARADLMRVQTPQAFRYDIVFEAHEKAVSENKRDFTDDCGLVINAGRKVKIAEGSEFNIKITSNSDFLLAEKMARLF